MCIYTLFVCAFAGFSCRFLWINMGLEEPEQNIQASDTQFSTDSIISSPGFVPAAKVHFPHLTPHNSCIVFCLCSLETKHLQTNVIAFLRRQISSVW